VAGARGPGCASGGRGTGRPSEASSLDGAMIRGRTTTANRGVGSVGTGDDSSPSRRSGRAIERLFDAGVRGCRTAGGGGGPATKGRRRAADCWTRHGAVPAPFAGDRIWLRTRELPGAARIARINRPHPRADQASRATSAKRNRRFLATALTSRNVGDGVTWRPRIEYFSTSGARRCRKWLPGHRPHGHR